jgi:tRNA-binding protein
MPETPLENEIKVGKILSAEKLDSDKPQMFKMEIDLGGEKVQSAAQLGYNHEPEEVEGKQVLCCTDLGEIRIAGFKSEVLTLGVPDENGNPGLVTPEEEDPQGGELY